MERAVPVKPCAIEGDHAEPVNRIVSRQNWKPVLLKIDMATTEHYPPLMGDPVIEIEFPAV